MTNTILFKQSLKPTKGRHLRQSADITGQSFYYGMSDSTEKKGGEWGIRAISSNNHVFRSHTGWM